MTNNHPLLIYHSDNVLNVQILRFFETGIDDNEKCVLITTQNDGDKIYQNLKQAKESSMVVRLFSYFSLPDPIDFPVEFEEKWNKLVKLILNNTFKGRIAFNVLCDISRYSPDLISKIQEIKKYIHSISNPNAKFLCTYKTGEKNDSLTSMLKIGYDIHDHIIHENYDDSISEATLK